MTAKKKPNESASVTATRLLLKKRRHALSLDTVNKALERIGVAPMTAADMDKHFKHVCVGGKIGQKWLLGGTPAADNTKRKNPAPEKKPTSKKIPAKKPSEKKDKCCKTETYETGICCKIVMDAEFNVADYNRHAGLHNAMANMPRSLEHPEEFVFICGTGDWPEEYRGVEIQHAEEFSGVLLCPRRNLRQVKI